MDPDRPILIFDGDCGFCRRWIERWRGITGDALDYAPYQEAAGRFPNIALKEFESSVVLIEPGGKTARGAEAVFRSLSASRSHRGWLWAYEKLPGAKPLSEAFYGFVASHRVLFSKLTRFFWGADVRRPSYCFSSSLFVRLVGAAYLIAFVSLGLQILGLAGSNGIWPAQDYLEAVQRQTGAQRFWLVPTLAWFSSSDAFLRVLCWGGAVFSVFVILGICPAFFLLLNWLFYLSLAGLGGPFLSFQWDILLLETGFLAVFFAPLDLRAKFLSSRGGPDLIRFLLKLLLFRLMFFSGFVKLASHDAVWKNLTALRYYYETQPLPPWTAWHIHHFPAAFHTVSCAFVFAVELVAPFFIFLPRRLRHASALLLILFQLLIMATGNYTFFNLLTIALCTLLLDDSAWPWKAASPACAPRLWPRAFTGAVSVLLILMTLGAFRFLQPFRFVNSYGLFAVMTTERPEIIVEGSDDGLVWLPYEFKYKAGDPDRKPAFVQPYQPRLDWQMWFAALGNYRQNRWFIRFCQKLLEGSPEVLALLKENPFPEHPPRYIRALLYDYRFTGPEEKKQTGNWWKRRLKGRYCPVLTVQGLAHLS